MAHLVKQTLEYSDGTETVFNYTANGNQEEIETTVAAAVAETSPEELTSDPVETLEEVVEEKTDEDDESADEVVVDEEIVLE